MKVFISWSGERSHAAALLLKEWLPKVINEVDPWVSSEDIAVGGDWSAEIAAELDQAKFGILCLTPENMGTPWILFEAGALSRQVGNQPSRVAPFLIGFKNKSDLPRPLGRFQSVESTREDVLKLLKAINVQCERRVAETQIEQMLDLIWDNFSRTCGEIAARVPAAQAPARSEQDKLDEILQTVRSLAASTLTNEGAHGLADSGRRIYSFDRSILLDDERFYGIVESECHSLNLFPASMSRVRGRDEVRLVFDAPAPWITLLIDTLKEKYGIKGTATIFQAAPGPDTKPTLPDMNRANV